MDYGEFKRNIIVMDNNISMQNSYGIVVMSDANHAKKRAQLYYEQLRNEKNAVIFTGHIAKGVLQSYEKNM